MDHYRSFFICLFYLLLLASCRAQEQAVVTPVTPESSATAAAETSTALPVAPTVTTTFAAATDIPLATPVPFTVPDLRRLGSRFDAVLAKEQEILSSYSIIDLATGQEISHNGDLALSGMSLVKIPILVESYRALDEAPTPAQMRLITETATLSGNYTANLLLELVAGRPDPFAGAQVVTQALRRLGLYNTFIAVPYDLKPDPQYLPTYATPANQDAALTTNPDTSMQTTTRDLARLLAMIYACAQDEGILRERYSQSLTPVECATILEVMSENRIDAFLEAGVPEDVPLAHKHGWVAETHGDAGLVLGEHPYVLVVALHRPGWLEWGDSTVLIGELSRLAYRHFHEPDFYPVGELATSLPPLPAPTATPALPRAVVAGTRGAGLTLRAGPGGAEIGILPEGIVVYVMPADAANAGGVSWRQVRAPWGEQGWVGADYLEALP